MNFSNITPIPSLFKILWCHFSAPRLKIKIMNKANSAQQSVPVWWCISLSFVFYPLPIPPPQDILVFLKLPHCHPPQELCTCWCVPTPLIWEIVPLPILSSSSDVLGILHSDVSQLRLYFSRKSILIPTTSKHQGHFLHVPFFQTTLLSP